MRFGFSDYLAMLKRRGPRLPLTYFFQNHLFDLIHGTDTHVWLPKAHYADRPGTLDHGVLYMSSWTRVIRETTRRALKAHALSPDDVAFVDVGCGKGKVLCVWAKMLPDRARLVGLEYSAGLLDICRANLQRIGAGRADLVLGDASEADFDFGCDVNLLFLYNPFDEEILARVLERIGSRKSVVIYNNPVHLEVFLDHGFHLLNEKAGWHPNASYALMSNIARG